MPARARPDACPGVFAPHDAADGALARIRLPGGALDAACLRVLAGCAEDLGDGRVHLTSRGNLQLRGLRRDDPELAARLTAAGLLPSATHERVRNVLASPLSGIAGGLTDVRTVAADLDRALCARPSLAALPGRFLFALDDGRGDVAAESPDLCWQAPGVLLVAGVPAGRVPPGQFRKATFLNSAGRNVAFLNSGGAVAALLDAAEVFLALRAADGGTAWRVGELDDPAPRIAAALGLDPVDPDELPPPGRDRLVGRRPGPVARDDGGTALVAAPVLGELTADQLRMLAQVAAAVVVTPWRTVVLPDPVPDAAALLAAAGLVVDPASPVPDVSACAGRPGCAKALADVRADARTGLTDGRFGAGRPVHLVGCERRCGTPRSAVEVLVAIDGGGYR